MLRNPLAFLSGLDISAQQVGFLVYLFDAAFHHIANRHNADQFSLLHYRQMTVAGFAFDLRQRLHLKNH